MCHRKAPNINTCIKGDWISLQCKTLKRESFLCGECQHSLELRIIYI